MKNALAAAIAAVVILSSQTHAGVPFKQFIGFGASYDDSGQFPDLDVDTSTGLRFTNVDPATGKRGLSFPEWLAIDLGLGRMNPSTPLLVFGPRSDTFDTDNINFAVGGYRSEEVLASVVGDSVVSVGPFTETQPGFLARVASGDVQFGPDTLFYALIAGNDIRDVDDPVQTADISAQIVSALLDAGAKTIVLPTLPRLGEFSESTNLTATGRTQLSLDRSAAAVAYNDAFASELNTLDGNFIRVDVLGLFDEVLADPVSFGYPASIDQTRYCYSNSELGGINCTEPAGLGKSGGGNPDDFVFNDGLHPTQAAAKAAADLIESVIRAPGMIALLPEAVLNDARAYQNTVNDYLVQNRWNRMPANLQLFAAVQGVDIDTGETWATPGASSDAVDLTIGGSYKIGMGWFVGAAIGSRQGNTKIDGRGSEFDTSALLGSVFAGYRCDIWFADVVLTMGNSDIDNIDRVFNIGSVQLRRESGDTEADVVGMSADIGVNMMSKDSVWRFGPFLALDYLDIDVDAYSEKGTRSSAMNFGDLNRESTVGSAGVFGSYPFALGSAALELYGDVAYVEEFEDHTDNVQAVVKSLSSGPSFRMPGYAIDNQGVRGTLGVNANWNSGVRVGLSYRYADNDVETQYLNLSASYGF